MKGVGVPVNMHAVIYYMHFVRYPYSFTTAETAVSYVLTYPIQAGCSNSAVGGKSFLDIGPATGKVTKELSCNFGRIDVLEPNKTHAEALKRCGYNVSHDYWQDANIEKDQYDLILAAHMIFLVPSHLWEMVI